ncbi:MAG: type I restriction enzyme HsdR N-terminal domain-containing protein [Bacteroidaceae bacterium]|nr:type I restriction enzyme HsdR N-terminal domain-containing protein [Bacteroidaceae bacterium]
MKTDFEQRFPPLNLPAAPLQFGEKGGWPTVFDSLRRRFVRLTPEEWVRQHFTSYLIREKGYPAGLLGNEVSLTLNGMARRCDSVLYGLDGQPRMIVEYKAPTVPLTQKVFDQIYRYNLVMRVEWLVISNGLQHVCCHLDIAAGTYEFVPQVPAYEDL